MTMTVNELLLDFEQYLVQDAKGAKTITSYLGDIKAFVQWLEHKKVNFKGNITRMYVNSYKEYLTSNNYSVNTYNKKINSLNCFNHFLISKGLCNEKAVYPNKDKIKVASGSENEVEIFTDKEVDDILFYLENKEKINQRDKVAILLLLYTGVRVSELVNIKIKDLDLLTLNLKVIGKGGKYREVPLKPEVAEVIKEYLQHDRKAHKQANSEHLLLTQRAGKMDKDTVNKLLNKHAKQLNQRMKPHKFRHTFCTRLLKKGVELTTVAKLAGHANIQTTASFYINTSRQDKENAVNLL